MTIRGGVVESAREPSEFGSEDQADGDSGTVAPLVALTTFDRVAEGVAVVEDFAQIRLAADPRPRPWP